MTIILILIVAHWYLSLFVQTFFQHRYAAHRMFVMSRAWERFFFILAYITQGSSYLSPYTYGVMHRMHHAKADTPDDPHSPRHDGSILKMMFRMRRTFEEIEEAYFATPGTTSPSDPCLYRNLPEWKAFDRFASSVASRIAWVAIYTGIYLWVAPSIWYIALIPVHVLMCPLQGGIINWFGHMNGYINFKLKDSSRNIISVDVWMLGEGLHNNHHRFPSRPDFSFHRREFDPTWPIIRALHGLGIIHLPRPDPHPQHQ